ncbi:metal-dependent protein hydrolase [Aspergillus eucalypticola CBS 122712]|uniref:Metal-dependent protein hydrolase n=1 Tax=Aspergillus eucalypticola (strain CBS 122712 / IBT 29274) TaxID=1448314 RepID=A0A317V337_ASPEC|nr:metal-dependent protein hydrolase [Aspergillus eucalypticola CBS 122712]PWY67468.1 metal-dependent protein hydrolase [Aspergillus eucalypticola CBS 122712]
MLRWRRFFTMAETAAKKVKTSSPLIGTHNGHFHADEALAVYLLRLLPTYSSSPLLRTRDPAQLATCHTVVDVGGEYDAASNRYDHHQRTFATTFPNHNTKLSSAGLVYMHFGRAIIAQHTSLPVDHEDVTLLYEKLYTDFIEAIDANDNGVSVYDPAAVSAANIQKRFKDGGITITSVVGDMNNPDPTCPPGEPQDEDSLFARASTFIGNVFARKLHHAVSSWLPARATVGAAYRSRRDVHPSGRIIVLPQGGVPWKEHLYNFEKEASGSEETNPDEEAYYVLYPESAAEDSKWRVQCVSVNEGSFVSRKPLPEAWRGVRDADLDGVMAAEAEKSGKPKVPEGAVFVHASGFIGGHQTKEGALAMATRGLEQ